jgi:prepilin-type N-terminal cleavage/methylation domain-containing protein
MKNQRGTSLVELLIAMAIFGLILGVMFTLYATMLKTATSTRKIAKVEGEIANTVWPIFKEIESAGFGVPANSSGGSCTPEISFTGGATNGVLAIFSTNTGPQTSAAQTAAGSWSYITTGCTVSGFNNGDTVSIINPSDKSSLGTTTVTGVTLNGCQPTWPGNIAYLSPAGGCFNTEYTLSATTTKTCAPGTQQLTRSSVAVGVAVNYQPALDCVLAFSSIFGCIDTSGNVTWQAGNTCPFLNSNGNYNPRFVRIGMVEQDSNQNEYAGPQPQPNIILFGDTTVSDTVSLTTAQGKYRWRTIERTISLKNLE